MLTPGGRRVVVKARSMACPACGETNRPERLYCARCGARLAAPCPACAAPSEPGEEFCGQCGLALAGGRPAVAPAPAMPATIAGGRYQLRCLLGEEAGQPYIVSQHMPGGSVDDLLQAADRHRLPIEQTLRIADEVCRALQH